jgi:hypothetical protein
MKLIHFFLATFFIMPKIGSIAQETGLKTIKGEIINMKREPLSFINIQILGTEKGTVSNAKGKFEIKAQASDTLVFSAIAFKSNIVAVEDLNPEYCFITLHDEVYELGRIDVFEMRWQDFKYEMMNLELKPIEQGIRIIEGLPNPYARLIPPKSLAGSPVSFIYEYLKRENVIKRKRKRWQRTYEKSYIKVE